MLEKAAEMAADAGAILFKANLNNNRKGYDPERTEAAHMRAYDIVMHDINRLEQIAFARLREAMETREAFDIEYFGSFIAVHDEEDEDPED